MKKSEKVRSRNEKRRWSTFTQKIFRGSQFLCEMAARMEWEHLPFTIFHFLYLASTSRYAGAGFLTLEKWGLVIDRWDFLKNASGIPLVWKTNKNFSSLGGTSFFKSRLLQISLKFGFLSRLWYQLKMAFLAITMGRAFAFISPFGELTKLFRHTDNGTQFFILALGLAPDFFVPWSYHMAYKHIWIHKR